MTINNWQLTLIFSTRKPQLNHIVTQLCGISSQIKRFLPNGRLTKSPGSRYLLSSLHENLFMSLSVEDQWMIAYINNRILRWGDVRDDAARTIKQVKSHQDFNDWASCFLPKKRKDEIHQALIKFKSTIERSHEPVLKPEQPIAKVGLRIEEKAAKLLMAKAKAERCTISDVVIRHLA